MLAHAAADPAPPFAIGDIVRLNSDRVHMTVGAVAGGRVACRWHDAEDDLLKEDFDPRELTLVRKREEAARC
ncbi:MAG: DUF2158 domain-containing protein [Roseiarcus sp.]|jgi:uncharacterized protein YodC (DUF2158 family)